MESVRDNRRPKLKQRNFLNLLMEHPNMVFVFFSEMKSCSPGVKAAIWLKQTATLSWFVFLNNFCVCCIGQFYSKAQFGSNSNNDQRAVERLLRVSGSEHKVSRYQIWGWCLCFEISFISKYQRSKEMKLRECL